MATKITDLAELAVAPASDDVLHIIDVGDTTGGAAGTSKKIQVSNLTGGGDNNFVYNGGGFFSSSLEYAMTFGMSTQDSPSFGYIQSVPIPINCRVVSVHSMSQSNGGLTAVRVYKPTALNQSVASQTELGTVTIASHTFATGHTATFDTSTYDFNAGDNLGVTFDSTTNLNGLIVTVLLKTI
tara:strand:+ start:238 stop:786 length:549 start_codon:yes stop_codon:yes gene_type:complete